MADSKVTVDYISAYGWLTPEGVYHCVEEEGHCSAIYALHDEGLCPASDSCEAEALGWIHLASEAAHCYGKAITLSQRRWLQKAQFIEVILKGEKVVL